ncbi:Peptidase family S41 [Microbulbifer donghaiensis]|uniref:Peptidase family S41 n=2 Tax=Microbulbifer donghaiensis TaxID=494016 RepID=A0A1M5AQE5_9GAMM|nr:Peptidase family S41 [Microbulbifer donghaiensis]
MRLNFLTSALISLLVLSSGAQALPDREVKKWTEDLDRYQQQLEEQHINLYHSVGKAQFTEALSALKKSLPELNEQQVLVEMMRITRLVGDGHTQFAIWSGDIAFFPFRFVNIDGTYRLIATSEPYKHLIGYKLRSIDGIQIDKIVALLTPVVQGVENQYSLKVRVTGHISSAPVLYGLGITKTVHRALYTFEDDEGRQATISVASIPMRHYHDQLDHTLVPERIPFGKKQVSENENLWLSADDETKTAYVYFRRYPSFSDMEDFAEDVREYLDEHETRNLIIDLRDNGGGDFFVGLGLAWGLVLADGLDWEQGVYTLIGNRTYSAAMSNAAQFRQILHAKLVGEPTGGNPVGYQDMDSFSLPNTGWTITYSKRNYRFQDSFSSGVRPDIMIETDWPSYRSGIDKPLAWIMKEISDRNRAYLNAAAKRKETP